ncbi:thioredoxin F-type, chloroplastic-like [Magnolia sinica]|uniref:thioredoxin F-type, chloroplastic-like n=1 Tax=Magnolia sinica TaxID=86752 RepID=UPI0026587BC4|nr:thioredoxin F-type, chloroplastic-like [Magnolia sinica]
MALQISISPQLMRSSSSSFLSWSPNQRPTAVSLDNIRSRISAPRKLAESGSRGVRVSVRSSLEMAGPVVGQVTEVNKDTFWPLVEGAGDKIVVVDMYTQWCGPCKLMAPKFQELSQKYLDVVFLKLDCNQENKPLAKELGIRVVPTFKILKDSKIVKEVTGAKFDDLVLAIDTIKSS